MPDVVVKEQENLSFDDIQFIINTHVTDMEGAAQKGLEGVGLAFANINGERLESEEAVLNAAKKDGLFIIPPDSDEAFYIHYGINPETGKSILSYSDVPLNTDEIMELLRDKAYDRLKRFNDNLREKDKFLKAPEKPVWKKDSNLENKADLKIDPKKDKNGAKDSTVNIDEIDGYTPFLTAEERINISQMKDTAFDVVFKAIYEEPSEDKKNDNYKKIDISVLKKHMLSYDNYKDGKYKKLDPIPLKGSVKIPQDELPKAPKLGFFASIAHKVKKTFDGKGTEAGRRYEKKYSEYREQRNALQEKYFILKEKEEGIYELNNGIRSYNKKIEANKNLLASQRFKDYTKWTKMNRDYENDLRKYKAERGDVMTEYPLLAYMDLQKNGVTLDNLDIYYEELKKGIIGKSFTKENDGKLAEFLFIKNLKDKYDDYKSKLFDPDYEKKREENAVSLEKGSLNLRIKDDVLKRTLADNRDIEMALEAYNNPERRLELIEENKNGLVIHRTLTEYRGKGEITEESLNKFLGKIHDNQSNLNQLQAWQMTDSFINKNKYLDAKATEAQLINELGNKPIGLETALILAKIKLLENEHNFTEKIQKFEAAFNADITNEKDPGYEILKDIADKDPEIKAFCEQYKDRTLPGNAILGMYQANKKTAEIQKKQKTV